MEERRKLSRFALTSIVAGLAGVIVGIILTVVGILIDQHNSVVSTILTSLGTATFTAALIGIIYESFQKEILTGDLHGIFQVSTALRGSGIINIADPSSETMADFFTQRDLTIIPMDPLEWYSHHKSTLYRAACKRPTRIEVWVPEYDDASVANILAQRGQQTAAEMGQALAKFMRQIESDWNTTDVHNGSYLEVKSYKDIPRVGVYSGETKSILEYQAASPESPTVYGYTWIEVGGEGDFHKWSLSEVSRVANNHGAGTRLIRPNRAQV